MRRLALLALFLSPTMQPSATEQPGWEIDKLRYLNQDLSRLPPADLRGIIHRLGGKSSDIRALRVETKSGPLFIVQSIGEDWCSPTGNCAFLILSGNYKILRETIAQTFQVQSDTHDGLPDVVTSMHGSATDSELKRWQFQGKYYVLAGCADALYGDNDGNWFKQPHIKPIAC